MEGHCILKVLFVCLVMIVGSLSASDIEFMDISLGTILIGDGSRGDIKCSVNVTNDWEYSISWYRKTPRGDQTVIYRDGMLITSNLGREAEAYSNHSTQGRIIIRNLIGQNLGYLLNGNNYTCVVSVNKTGEVVLVSSGVILEVRYSPSPVYPICESCEFLSDFINTSITISCYSEPGEPTVELMWLKNGERIHDLQTITTSSFIYLNYTFILEADDLQSLFICNNSVNSCNLSSNNIICEQNTLPDSTNVPSKSSSGKELPIIIGASVGSAVFLAICMLLICVCIKKRRDSKSNKPMSVNSNQHELQPHATNKIYINNDIKEENGESGTIENLIYDGYVETENTKPETTHFEYDYAYVNK